MIWLVASLFSWFLCVEEMGNNIAISRDVWQQWGEVGAGQSKEKHILAGVSQLCSMTKVDLWKQAVQVEAIVPDIPVLAPQDSNDA